jgi:DNA ligase D-like protein (predicted 3'-phosphoesterase)
MPRFVIHKHSARRLHYDFRLELDSVLKSWAVPKEPPLEPGIKRLAVEVEDHALSYVSFEGEIPEGSYGAGGVKIWDSGEYELKERGPDKLVFTLHGKRMTGEYCLLRFKSQDKNTWLLFRMKA